MTTKKTAAKILNGAADLLAEEDRWTQGAYFRKTQGAYFRKKIDCSMCANSAIEYCGNPKVKRLIDTGKLVDDYGDINEIAEDHTNKGGCGKSTNSIIEAHSYAYKVGLSVAFNDQYGTTKRQVISKLREAAKLAQKELQ